jgi:hypothetical protein
MEENKTPTAEEFCKDLQSDYEETGEYKMYYAIDIPNKLREFAKLHVKAALEAAAENAKAFHQYPWTHNDPYVDVHSVTSAYPESNIK